MHLGHCIPICQQGNSSISSVGQITDTWSILANTVNTTLLSYIHFDIIIAFPPVPPLLSPACEEAPLLTFV